MAEIEVHYEIQLADGTVFDSTFVRNQPVTVDSENLPFPEVVNERLAAIDPGVREAIAVPCKDGYGDRDEALVFVAERAKLPSDFVPKVGAMLSFTLDENELLVTVLGFNDEAVTLDGNHPLAGQDVVIIVERLPEQ